MTPSGQIKKYKQQLISLFVNNEKIVKLINEKDISNPEDLIYHNFFNFIRVPETIDEERNYICVKIDVPEVYTSSLFFKQIIITIYVVSHQKQMVTEFGGARPDLIAEQIEEILIDYEGIGKKKLVEISNVEKDLGDRHRCRILKFKAEDMSKSRCAM